MKIDGLNSKIVKKKSRSSAKKVSGDIPFSALLADQIQAPIETSASEDIKPVPANSNLSAAARTTGITLTEQTIDFLTSYGDALANLNLDPEAILPLVEAMETGTTSLLDLKEQLPADDPLAELLDRVAAVAYLEAEKYRRGDYSS